jgi:predicted metal-dependent phosphoesterase TrpH
MYKIDFHTHSHTSKDGGITPEEYHTILREGLLDCVAITDHNEIETAQMLHKSLGAKIIVGEEIMTNEGEIVGLFLSKFIEPYQTVEQTIQAIHEQNGIVYIPHPFETVRKGLHPEALERIVHQVDIVEVCNGRAFLQNKSQQTVVWARLNHVPGAASSDAHGVAGLGRTYTQLKEIPTAKTLKQLMQTAVPITQRPTLRALLYPKYHVVRKKIKKPNRMAS